MKYDIIANIDDFNYTMRIFNEEDQTVIFYKMTPQELSYLHTRITHYLEFREKRVEGA